MHKLLAMAFILLACLLLTACKKETKSYSGYIDADLIYLSADFGGRLSDLAVHRGQLVKPNEFLFKLEQTSELYRLAMSKLNTKNLNAEREQILIQLDYDQSNFKRIQGMRKQDAASQDDLEKAQRDLNISKQKLAAIDLKIKNNQLDTDDKQWMLTRKENFAPEPGLIFDTYFNKGEFVQAGFPVLSLITKDKIKAVFFISEEQLSNIKLNRKINIQTDNHASFAEGHIVYISNIAEFTSPIIYSREERERLVYRVEIKIDKPDLEKIHLGEPVTLELA